MAMVLSKAVSIWRHDDITISDDEEEEHSDDLISDSEEDEREGAGTAAATPAPDDRNDSGASGDGENEFDYGAEDIWVDDEDEYFIGDVPELPRYQCHRTWRSYHVPEDE
jgi:hypothetical protein